MPAVREALDRIADKEQFDRTFRIRRAMQLQLEHRELSREDWVTAQTDMSYLWPHIVQVCKEKRERRQYDEYQSQRVDKPPSYT
jgi:ubiquinol-cytochrome c reductase subunit 7